MARDGSGTYTLPAGNPVVAGTAINPTTHNTTMNDIAAELTNSVDKGGRTALTGNLPMGGYKLTNLAAGSSANDSARVAQVPVTAETTVTLTAATTDIGAQVTAHHLILDGAGVTVTAFAASTVGYWKRVRFNGVNTLTHGASFYLPGAANITTASGDEADFHYTSAGWKCTAYYKVSGLATVLGAVSGSWVLLGSVTCSGATATLENGVSGIVFDTTYDEYEVAFFGVSPAAAAYLLCAAKVSGAYDIVGFDSVMTQQQSTTVTTLGSSSLILNSSSSNTVHAASDGGFTGNMKVFQPGVSGGFRAHWEGGYRSSGGTQFVNCSGKAFRPTPAVVTGLQFSFVSSTFDGGTIRLFGRKL